MESLGSWPADGARRWLLRLLLSLPFVALSLSAWRAEAPTPLNVVTDDAGNAIRWGSGDFGWISAAYPPVPVGIAGVLPGGTLALGLVGAFVAGALIHSLVERLVRRETPAWLVVLLVATLAATPFFGYMASASLAEFLGFSLVTIAMAGFLRFAMDGDTDGGFQAGLLLGLAAACDASTVVFALFLGLAAPFVAHRRFRASPLVGRASAAVLAFPAVMAVLGWAFLEWRFTGSAFAVLQRSIAAAEPSWSSLGSVTTAVAVVMTQLPLFVLCGILLFLRRRPALIGYLLPFPALVLSLWLGLRAPSGLTVMLYTALALLAVPARPSRPVAALLAVAAVGQLALTWVFIVSRSAEVEQWTRTLLDGIG